MAKQPKPLTLETSIEFKNATGEHTGTILADRGIAWLVLSEGETYPVPKKQVTRQWAPTEEEQAATLEEAQELDQAEEELYGKPSTLAQQLAGTPAPAPAAPKAKEKDPDLVTLADLCTEYKIVGRIARRRLRGSIGTVGTGSRWEWKKDSADLVKVRAILNPPAPVAADPAPVEELASLEDRGPEGLADLASNEAE